MKKKAVIYARQSSGDDDYSESVAVQIANCQELAAKENLEVTGIFSDLNTSGKTYPAGWEKLAAADQAFQRYLAGSRTHRRTRSGLGQAMKMLKSVNYIIVDDITRLYRPLNCSFLEAAVNESLIANQVQILQVKGGRLDLAQFDQQLITTLKNQINDEQIAKQRQRSIEVQNKLRDSGIMPTGITAFGLVYDKNTKRYTVDAEKIRAVQFAFSAALQKRSFGSIVRQINTRFGDFFGGCFREKTLCEMLCRPIYAGCQYNTQGELIKNIQGEGAISREKFLAVQKIIAERKLQRHGIPVHERKKHWLPLSGKLFCGNCGSRLLSVIEDGKVFYICRRGHLCSDAQCRQSRISMRCSKPYLAGLIDAVQAVLGRVLCRKIQNSDDEPNTAEQILPTVTDCRERLRALTLEFARGNLPVKLFHAAVAEVNSRLRAERSGNLQKTDNQIQQQQYYLGLLANYQNNTLTMNEFDELLAACTLRVDVYDENVMINLDGEKFEFKRHVRCRQKGFSAHMTGKLRRRFAAEAKEDLIDAKNG